jgi:hypothetical protein
LADLDDDGLLDVATADRGSDGVSVLRGTGNGGLAEPLFFPVTTEPRSIAALDLNGDETIDLVTADFESDNVSVLFNIAEDCNGNGVADSRDISSGLSADTNDNGVPDECEGGGQQLAGDCNQDGVLDLADSVCILGVLFLGYPDTFPCGNGSARHPSNIALLDAQPDGAIDLSDAIVAIRFLFLGGPAHQLALQGGGTNCFPIPDCPENPGCD